MRLKKIALMLICAVLMCFALVSCDEDEIPQYPYEKEVVENIYYDFYIIVEDGTDDISMKTVNRELNSMLNADYSTKLNIRYLSASEYETVLQAELGAPASEKLSTELNGYKYGGKIVLINNVSMLSYLGEGLADLSSYLDTDEYGRLNTEITQTLITAAKDSNGKLLAMPNNHVFGEYKYIAVNRDIAEKVFKFSAQTDILEMTSMDAQKTLDLQEAVLASGYEFSDVVREISGPYALKALIESGSYTHEGYTYDAEWMCNVSVAPIATADVAFESAFGVLPAADIVVGDKTTSTVERAMDIIYAINTDDEVRNTLQYGFENSNYKVVEKEMVDEKGKAVTVKYVIPIETDGRSYRMNIEYTGTVFRAYCFEGASWGISENDDWTYQDLLYGKAQNADSVN